LKKEQKKVYAAATHGIFCNHSLKKLNDSPLEEIVITDTLKIKDNDNFEKLKIISVAPLIGEAIKGSRTFFDK